MFRDFGCAVALYAVWCVVHHGKNWASDGYASYRCVVNHGKHWASDGHASYRHQLFGGGGGGAV